MADDRPRPLVVSPPSSSSFSCPAAAAVVDDRRRPKKRLVVCPLLPFDIVLHHILVLLPAISLLRFRSVCKSWLSAIADPRFIASHTERSVNSHSLLLFRIKCRDLFLYNYNRSCTHKILSIRDLFPSPPPPHYASSAAADKDDHIPLNQITPSVNGLILLHSIQNKRTPKPYTRIHICNPCTREIFTLPVLDVFLGTLNITHDPINLGCKIIYYCGAETFWFSADPSTGKYKVVRFMTKGMTAPSLCHVFTQGNDCWKEVAPSPPFALLEKYPVSLNGVLYGTAGAADGMILSFDLTKDKIASIPQPPNLNGVEVGYSRVAGLRTIVVLQQRLSVVDCPLDKTMDIWMLLKDQPCKNNNNNIIINGGGGGKYEWSKVYSFEMSIPQVGILQPMIKRITTTREGNFLLGTFSGTLFSFDPKTKSLSHLLTKKEQYKYWLETSFPPRGSMDIDTLLCSTPYAETLAPAS